MSHLLEIRIVNQRQQPLNSSEEWDMEIFKGAAEAKTRRFKSASIIQAVFVFHQRMMSGICRSVLARQSPPYHYGVRGLVLFSVALTVFCIAVLAATASRPFHPQAAQRIVFQVRSAALKVEIRDDPLCARCTIELTKVVRPIDPPTASP